MTTQGSDPTNDIRGQDIQDYDLFVIGGGSGGVRCARMAATMGARVALVESSHLGGTCVNLGCIPKKLFVYASHFHDEMQDAEGFGWTVGESSFDWQTLVANKDKEIARLNSVYGRILDSAGVDRFEGHGRLVGANAVQVTSNGAPPRVFGAENILLATGSWPKHPNIPGVELTLTSNEFFHLEKLPRSMLILGGGFIGLEFAGVLHRLGVKVELVHRHPFPLNGFDDDVRRFVCDEMERQGIRMHLSATVARIERCTDGGFLATMQSGVQIETDQVLSAIGRHPRTEGLGLEAVGVACGGWGQILVDEEYRTNVPSIFAVGDVVGRSTLTPVALAEGMRVAHTLFGERALPALDYDSIPSAVFSQPPVAAAGLTEQVARERGHEVVIYRTAFTPLKLTLSNRRERSMMKLVVDRQSDRVLGVHMVGADAAEIVQGFAVAVTAGLTKSQFDATIGIHPTAAEEFVTMRTPIESQ